MSYLFFETESQLCEATKHLVHPSKRGHVRGSEVRRYDRRPAVVLFAVLKVSTEEATPVAMFSTNLSPVGVFLKTDEHFFQIGETLLLEFVSAVTQRSVKVWGRVARVAASHVSSVSGVGIEFKDLDEIQRYELAQLTEERSVNVAYAH